MHSLSQFQPGSRNRTAISRLVGVLVIMTLSYTFTSVVVGQSPSFIERAEARLRKEYGTKPEQRDLLRSVCAYETDPLAERVFFEYGSIFVATEKVRVPRTCIFDSPDEVTAFQMGLETEEHHIGGVSIRLQEKALKQLLKAVDEAKQLRHSITPLDGSIAAGRDYHDTVRVWNSRFLRALEYWARRGRIDQASADEARRSAVRRQIDRVLQWESEGLFFSTNLSKSIFYSVAPPGTSQHLSLLAFDVAEAGNPIVRRILNKYGWFQTIRTDQPHFAFLGHDETELPQRGLQNVMHQGNSYWVPTRPLQVPRGPGTVISKH